MSSAPQPIVAVIGASGNIGTLLINLLSQQQQYQIRAIGRDVNISKPGLTNVCVSDWKDESQLDKACEGVSHFVFIKPFSEDVVSFTSKWCLAFSRKHAVQPIQQIILISAVGTDWYRDKYTFSNGQYQCELLVEATGIPFTHLRPGFFHTNMLNHIESIKTNNAFYTPWGSAAFCGITPEDIAVTIACILKSPQQHLRKSYTLTCRDLRSGKQIAEALSKALGRTINYVAMDAASFKAALSAQVPKWLAEYLSELALMIECGDARWISPDLKDITGRDGTSFEQWAFENVHLFK